MMVPAFSPTWDLESPESPDYYSFSEDFLLRSWAIAQNRLKSLKKLGRVDVDRSECEYMFLVTSR